MISYSHIWWIVEKYGYQDRPPAQEEWQEALRSSLTCIAKAGGTKDSFHEIWLKFLHIQWSDTLLVSPTSRWRLVLESGSNCLRRLWLDQIRIARNGREKNNLCTLLVLPDEYVLRLENVEQLVDIYFELKSAQNHLVSKSIEITCLHGKYLFLWTQLILVHTTWKYLAIWWHHDKYRIQYTACAIYMSHFSKIDQSGI